MAYVTLAEARLHLRHDSGTTEDSLISMWLDVAEAQCIAFLGRNVYENQDALTTAQAAAPAALEAAQAVHEAALTEYAEVEDDDERAAKTEAATLAWVNAQQEYLATMNGIVVNDSIKAATLLHAAYLFAQRTPEAEMPKTHRSLLWPFRFGLGV